MIKVYILIVLWGSPNSYHKAALQAEFTSMAKCQAAGYVISKETWAKHKENPVLICAEK